jgi:hypothetical protein
MVHYNVLGKDLTRPAIEQYRYVLSGGMQNTSEIESPSILNVKIFHQKPGFGLTRKPRSGPEDDEYGSETLDNLKLYF